MSTGKTPPGTFDEAVTRGHSLIDAVDAHSLPENERSSLIDSRNAKPQDMAWHGPCVGGKRIVVYYDENMAPSKSVVVDC